jgi:electron transport complex protein RnfB
VSELREHGAEACAVPAGASTSPGTVRADSERLPDAVGARLLVDAIDEVLPQTQCRRCGFEGCRPYAEALAEGRSEINRCPPGGDMGVVRLSRLLGRPFQPIDPACGRADAPRLIAHIVAADCIGCTMCIQACPVDAIIGAPKRMHTVIAAHCTGCELCVPPCPVDCIVLEPIAAEAVWNEEQARASRRRHQARQARLARRELERAQARIDEGTAKLAEIDRGRAASALGARDPVASDPPVSVAAAAASEASATMSAPTTEMNTADPGDARKRAIIEAAIRRARERLATSESQRPMERP